MSFRFGILHHSCTPFLESAQKKKPHDITPWSFAYFSLYPLYPEKCITVYHFENFPEKIPPNFFRPPLRGSAKKPLYLENFRAFGPVSGRIFLPSTLPVARKMVEKGRKDRKIGLFQPSKSPKIREKSRQNSPKPRQNDGKTAAKHRRRASFKVSRGGLNW